MAQKEKPKRNTFGTIVKNLFFLIIILQLAPSLFTNLKTTMSEVMTPKTSVGYLKLKGMISNSEPYTRHIHKLLKDDNVKALLVQVDSGGGTPGSNQAIFLELKKFALQKPVVAFVEDMCASGAYYAICGAHSIVSLPSSILGSIGVMLGIQGGMPIPNLTERMNDWKISFEYIQGGKYKTAGNFFKKNSPDELKLLQSVVDDSYAQFVNDVAQSRNLSVRKAAVWADGKIFTGNQALQVGLIDKIGSYQDALDEIKKRANITDEIRLIKPTRPTGLMAYLRGDNGDYHAPTMSLPECIGSYMSTIWSSFCAAQNKRLVTC